MYYRARLYDTATGEITSQDPIEMVDGMSLYSAYFIPSGIDPSGLELIFDPKEVVGHPWRNALIGEWYTPALGGKKKFDHKAYGRTILDLSIEGVCTCKGGGNWTLEFELLLTTEILLNLELIAKGKRSPGGIIYTKENVYGHEQRHVLANRSKAIEIYVGLIINFEGEFNDVGACHAALKKGMKEARTMWNTWRKQNPHRRNSNPLNPANRKPYAPIDGVFPKAPGN